MSELFALTSAVSYGFADFLGGLASRRRHVLRVLVIAHPIGLVVVAIAALISGGSPGAADLWWGAAAGSAGLLGLGFFYRSLAIGTMGVVAPVTATVGAAIPVIAGVALGERPNRAVLVGVGVALLAILLVSAGDSTGWIEDRATMKKALGGSLVAGLGFGLFFVLIERVGSEAGMWPLVAARATSSAIIVLLLVLVRPVPARRGARQSVVAGVLDVTANMFVLLAFDGGLLVIVSALAALYPAVTVLLARFVLLERMRTVQLVGVGLAIMAVPLISSG